ncbi:MAG: SPFH domain-containing protein [Pirellulales bacterium]
MSRTLLLGQFEELGLTSGTLFWIAVSAALAVVGVAGFFFLFVKRYRRCPANRVLVIYGRTSGGGVSKTIHGGAKWIVPLLEDYEYLSLEPIQINIPLRGALSIENIRVNVPSVFTVAIGTEPEYMQNAAIRLLGLPVAAIQGQAEEIIFGQLRQVIASMLIEDINRNRDTFLHLIQSSLEPELKKVGLVLINVNITDITDESGYIDAIGQKAASTAIQQARGDVAEQEKLGEVRVAEADRDKMISVAEASKFRSIGTRQAQREEAVRLAELDKEQQYGEQKAAYEREALVKQSEQEMRIAKATADANAIEGENESQARVAASLAILKVKESEAYQIGESRKREAEAAVLETQNRAMAKAALADAERVEAEQRAAMEAPAKAAKARAIVEAQAVAERRRIEAEGEAAAIFAKLDAEARGQYQMLAKKGEGLREIIQACGGATQAFQLLMLEHIDNLAASSAEAISKIKFDKVVVWENGGHNGETSTANFLQGMSRVMPPMMQVLKDIGGIELPETLIKVRSDEVPHPAAEVPDDSEAQNGDPLAETAGGGLKAPKSRGDNGGSDSGRL